MRARAIVLIHTWSFKAALAADAFNGGAMGFHLQALGQTLP